MNHVLYIDHFQEDYPLYGYPISTTIGIVPPERLPRVQCGGQTRIPCGHVERDQTPQNQELILEMFSVVRFFTGICCVSFSFTKFMVVWNDEIWNVYVYCILNMYIWKIYRYIWKIYEMCSSPPRMQEWHVKVREPPVDSSPKNVIILVLTGIL